MPQLRFDVWKHSSVYGLDRYWFNRWYLNVAEPRDQTYLVANWLPLLEAQQHRNHVEYTHITTIDLPNWGTPQGHVVDVTTFSPGHLLGAFDSNTDQAGFEYVKRIKKWPLLGRSGHFWFRGGLETAEVTPGNYHTHDGTNNLRMWDGIAHDWIQALSDRGATLYIGNEDPIAGIPVSYNPVTKLSYSGITKANATKRSNARAAGTGQTIWEALPHRVIEWRNECFEIGTYWNNHNDFTPVAIKDHAVTELGLLRGFFNTIKEYCGGSGGGGGGGSAPPTFRFQPDADRVGTLANTVVTNIENDLDTVNNFVPWTPDGVNYYILFSDMDTLLDLIFKYITNCAEIGIVDWRNPSNP